MKRKIIAVICIAAGLAVMSVPLIYSFCGRDRTDRLIKEIEQTIVENSGDKGKAKPSDGETGTDEKTDASFQTGDVMGIVEMESLDLKYPVVEGAGSAELSVGIGHIPGTAGIGEMGNCVLAGHRGSRYGTYFKYLNRLQQGDVVKLTDHEGRVYLYEVSGSEVVGPYENSVKDHRQEKELTLLTCENSGTMRLIVRCQWKGMEE